MGGNVPPLRPALSRLVSARPVQPSIRAAYCQPPVRPHLRTETSGRGFRRDLCRLADAALRMEAALPELAGAAQAALPRQADEADPRGDAAYSPGRIVHAGRRNERPPCRALRPARGALSGRS